MIVLDTNILVRVITKDDVDQARLAAAVLSGPGPFWISRVVLLELGWTLKSRYKNSRAEVSRALHLVVALDHVQVEDDDVVRRALGFHAAGMDLGDAFILASAPPGSKVATFDQDFVRLAERALGVPLAVHRLIATPRDEETSTAEE